jgi:serine/threonine-protein kinase
MSDPDDIRTNLLQAWAGSRKAQRRGDAGSRFPYGASQLPAFWSCVTVSYESFKPREPPLPFDESAGNTAPSACGPYRVLHQIGSGVLGPVFRTYDPQHDRLVAIKSFRLDLPPEHVARLADALRRLTTISVPHHGVVPVFDAGLEGTTAYLASEYVAAETLDVTLRHLAPASLERALPIINRMAEAIDAAAAVGLTHGALHPRDVFVTLDTQDVRLVGFGVAQALESQSIKAPVRRPYTAPERAVGDPWGTRADIYSLGALAHELLTRRRPGASGEQDGALTSDTTAEQRVQIRRVLSIVLADRPEERFPTAKAFADALGSILQREIQVQPGLPLVVASGSEPSVSAEEIIDEPAASAEVALGSIAPDSGDQPADIAAPLATAPVLHTREDAVEPSPAVETETELWKPILVNGPAPEVEQLIRATPAALHVVSESPRRRPTATFPWAAIAAVAAAGVALGAVVEYGYLRQSAGVEPYATTPGAAASVTPTPPATPPPMTTVVTEEPRPAAEAPPPSPSPRPSVPASPRAHSSAPRARSRDGRLIVRSVPAGALVIVDGRRSGQTPMTVSDLTLGAHRVEVARSGYVPYSDSLTLSGNAPVRSVSVHLRPGLSSENAGRATAASQAPAVRSDRGSIFVDSRPQKARVLIDGQFVGLTPLRVPEVRLGVHSVRMEMAGYQPFLTTVGIRAGQQEQVTGALEERQD